MSSKKPELRNQAKVAAWLAGGPKPSAGKPKHPEPPEEQQSLPGSDFWKPKNAIEETGKPPTPVVAVQKCNRPHVEPGMAALLSLLVPGLGQLCQGRTLDGAVTMVAMLLFYGIAILLSVALIGLLILPLVFVLHMFVVVSAARHGKPMP